MSCIARIMSCIARIMSCIARIMSCIARIMSCIARNSSIHQLFRAVKAAHFFLIAASPQPWSHSHTHLMCLPKHGDPRTLPLMCCPPRVTPT
jgi:hypothetical protein